MTASIRKIAKPGEFICACHGGVFGLVLEVVKAGKNTRYRIDLNRWVFHDELSQPRNDNFEDLVRFYDSCARYQDRMASLREFEGNFELGGRVMNQLLEFLTVAAFKLAHHKQPNKDLRRIMLDFGLRAGFSDAHMAVGQAIKTAA